MNNALRHGRPRTLKISLRREGAAESVLQVENDGAALKNHRGARPEGIGLRVMDYRANLIGGTLHIANLMRGGVRVTCRFPCKPAPESGETTAGARKTKKAKKRPAPLTLHRVGTPTPVPAPGSPDRPA